MYFPVQSDFWKIDLQVVLFYDIRKVRITFSISIRGLIYRKFLFIAYNPSERRRAAFTWTDLRFGSNGTEGVKIIFRFS